MSDDQNAELLALVKSLSDRVNALEGEIKTIQLVNAQNELAFRKRRLRDPGIDPDSDPVSARWREEIAVLRGRLDA